MKLIRVSGCCIPVISISCLLMPCTVLILVAPVVTPCLQQIDSGGGNLGEVV